MKHLSALLILLLILMFPCFSSDEDLYRAASMGNPSDVVLAAVSTGSLFVEEEDGWNALFYAATNRDAQHCRRYRLDVCGYVQSEP